MNINVFKTKKDYDAYALSIIEEFGSVDDWLQFFDIWDYQDEKYDEVNNWNEFLHNEYARGKLHIQYSPSINEFPIVLVSMFDSSWDRCGDINTEIWDWKSFDELGIK